MSTPAEAAALYAVLEEVLGREPATTLMEQLPSRATYATKDDLLVSEQALRVDLGTRFDRIDAKFDQIEARFDTIETKFEAKFEKVDDRLHQLHLSMHGYVRTFVIAQVTSIFGAVGLFFGINQLI